MAKNHRVFLFTLLCCFLKTPLATAQAGQKGKISGLSFNSSSIEDIDSKNFPDKIKSFDYPNAKISDIVKAMSNLTGLNFIVDPSIKGSISIIAPSPITVAEAFQAFLSALAVNGYSLVRSGAFWKVISAEKASRDNTQIYTGEYFPEADHFITKIFKLKHTNVKNLEVHLKQFLTEKKHKVVFYETANTIIVSDYGSTIEKISQIIKELDVPDVNNLVEVIPVKYAPALDIASKLQILISRKPSSRRSGKPGSNLVAFSKSGHTGVSAIIPDERTNSVVIAGSKDGIKKAKTLIKKLDFYINPQIAGGIFVYYVKHGKAEEIEKTLNTILNPSAVSLQRKGKSSSRNLRNTRPLRFRNFFGSNEGFSNIAVSHDKNTNSLIVTASRHDYDILKGILEKIDIPKNQVFIKTIIMNLNAEDNLNWNVSSYKFLNKINEGGFIPRIGFSSAKLQDILGLPTEGGESIFSFGSGEKVKINIPQNLASLLGLPASSSGTSEGDENSSDNKASSDTSFQIPSIISLVNLIKRQTGATILSTPQIIAMDNEESSISVGLNAPVGTRIQQGNVNFGPTESIERKDIDTTLKITPYINPDGQSVRLIIEQKIDSITPTQAVPAKLSESAVTVTKREIKTNVILNNEETAVIGGLMTDDEKEITKKVPILGDIPILGWLFRTKDRQKQKTNLVIFITPKIIKTVTDHHKILKDKLDERMNFIRQFMGNKNPSEGQFNRILKSFSPIEKPMNTAQSPKLQKTKEEDQNRVFKEDSSNEEETHLEHDLLNELDTSDSQNSP